MAKNRANERAEWEEEQAMTKGEVMKARGAWHVTKVRVALVSSHLGARNIFEAHCCCGWAHAFPTFAAAEMGGKVHEEMPENE